MLLLVAAAALLYPWHLFDQGYAHAVGIRAGLKSGQMKIALGVDSKESLTALQIAAAGQGLPFNVCIDAGHTQVAAGTVTQISLCLAPCVYSPPFIFVRVSPWASACCEWHAFPVGVRPTMVSALLPQSG